MRILIVTMTTLALAGALVSTLAAARDYDDPGPRVTDLEVFGDGVTFVAAGGLVGFGVDGGAVQVQVKAKGVVSGECLSPGGQALRRAFAVPMVLKGTGAPKGIGRGELAFFARTDPPRLTSAEVCPSSEWSVAVADVAFVGAKLQFGRGGGARLLCQFPAVDGPVADPSCRLLP